MLVYLLFSCWFLFLSVNAICCKNHKWECIVNAITCTPNCPDKVSYCAPDKETCANNGLGDTWGGCVDIRTITELRFAPTTTVTTYTGTITKTTATQTFYTYNTQVTTVLVTEVRTQVRTLTSLTTTTTTVQSKLRFLAKREITSTKTLTQSPCSTSRDAKCTSTQPALWTVNVVATETRNSAVPSTYRSTIYTTTTQESVWWSTITVTRTVAGVVQPQPQPQPQTTTQVTTITSSQGTSTIVVTEVATKTFDPAGTDTSQIAATSGIISSNQNSAANSGPSTSSKDGPLSTGAKAAIGTTVGTFVIAIIGLAVFCRRKRKEKKLVYSPVNSTPQYGHAPPQMVGSYEYQPYGPVPVRKPVPLPTQAGYTPLHPQSPPPMHAQQLYQYPAPSPTNPYQYPPQPIYTHHQVSPVHEVYARPHYSPYSAHTPQ